MKNTKVIEAYSHLGNKREWWLEERAAEAFERMRNEWQRVRKSKFRISDAGRTHAEQVAVKKLKGKLAATPGKSWHEAGLAIDVDVAYLKSVTGMSQQQLEDWMAAFGWIRTVKNENWHFEYHQDVRRFNVGKQIEYIGNNI